MNGLVHLYPGGSKSKSRSLSKVLLVSKMRFQDISRRSRAAGPSTQSRFEGHSRDCH